MWYSIELLEYDSTECHIDETEDEIATNQVIVEDCLSELFCALSKLPSGGNMTLDISVLSPSDTQHLFKYIRFEPANTLSSSSTLKPVYYGNSVHNYPIQDLSIASIDRLFSRMCFHFGFWSGFP
jgi:hypothetical protein